MFWHEYRDRYRVRQVFFSTVTVVAHQVHSCGANDSHPRRKVELVLKNVGKVFLESGEEGEIEETEGEEAENDADD